MGVNALPVGQPYNTWHVRRRRRFLSRSAFASRDCIGDDTRALAQPSPSSVAYASPTDEPRCARMRAG